jgi:hypothetical protein
MRAWEYSLSVPHRPGSLASLGEALGKAGINIEAIDAHAFRGQGFVRLVVTDRRAEAILRRFASVGFAIESECEVVIESLDDHPGSLGERALQIADQGISLTSLHVATGSRIVMGADDLDELERAWNAVLALDGEVLRR